MNARVITLGEIMLRLKSPGFERLLQTPILEATFGGGEANVAVSLATFGLDVAFVTALPVNPIGEACISYLRSRGVDTSLIKRGGERIGIYFLEEGVNQRPSTVIYDRSNSSFATINPNSLDWDFIFDRASWLHITGITPALSQSTADIALCAIRIAKEKGLTVSCDYNYRKKLWKYGISAPEVMGKLVSKIDIGIANEEDCQLSLGIAVETGDWVQEIRSGEIDVAKYRTLCEKVFMVYPNLKYQAITLRESYSANHNGWSACLYNGKDFYISRRYDITHIVDRVGAGDAFSAGLIYAVIKGMADQEALSFAVAASCLKHSIAGDMNLATIDEVSRLLSGDISGRVQR